MRFIRELGREEEEGTKKGIWRTLINALHWYLGIRRVDDKGKERGPQVPKATHLYKDNIEAQFMKQLFPPSPLPSPSPIVRFSLLAWPFSMC